MSNISSTPQIILPYYSSHKDFILLEEICRAIGKCLSAHTPIRNLQYSNNIKTIRMILCILSITCHLYPCILANKLVLFLCALAFLWIKHLKAICNKLLFQLFSVKVLFKESIHPLAILLPVITETPGMCRAMKHHEHLWRGLGGV